LPKSPLFEAGHCRCPTGCRGPRRVWLDQTVLTLRVVARHHRFIERGVGPRRWMTSSKGGCPILPSRPGGPRYSPNRQAKWPLSARGVGRGDFSRRGTMADNDRNGVVDKRPDRLYGLRNSRSLGGTLAGNWLQIAARSEVVDRARSNPPRTWAQLPGAGRASVARQRTTCPQLIRVGGKPTPPGGWLGGALQAPFF